MGLLSQVKKGKAQAPPRIVVYGTEGIGKSSLAAAAPNPVFLDTENGLGEIDAAKFPVATAWEDIQGQLKALATEDHDYGTVVVDSIDWLERLVWDRACKDSGAEYVEKIDGGYGKGYTYVLRYWREFLSSLDLLRAHRGMCCILVAHSKAEKVEDPENPTYSQYAPRLQKWACGLVVEWADAVLFATRKLRTSSEDTGFNRKRTIAAALGKDGGERILRTVGGPACIAKNRYGIPGDIPLSWDALVAAIAASQETGTQSQTVTATNNQKGAA